MWAISLTNNRSLLLVVISAIFSYARVLNPSTKPVEALNVYVVPVLVLGQVKAYIPVLVEYIDIKVSGFTCSGPVFRGITSNLFIFSRPDAAYDKLSILLNMFVSKPKLPAPAAVTPINPV